MGLRFKKSFKIAPGVKINLGKKGASMTLGGKHLKVTTGTSGTRVTASAGGGLSYTHKVGKQGSSRRAGAPRAARQASAPSQYVHVKTQVMLDDESGEVYLLTERGERLDQSTFKDMHKDSRDQIVQIVEEEVNRQREQIEGLGKLQLLNRAAFIAPKLEPRRGPQPPQSTPFEVSSGRKFLAMFWAKERARQAAQLIEHAEIEAEAARAYEAQREAFEAHEARRRWEFEVGRHRDPEVMEAYLERELGGLKWQRETLVSFEVRDGHTLIFDVDLPEIEHMPEEEPKLSKRPLGMTFKAISEVNRRKLYMNHVHAIGLVLLGLGFSRLSTVETVIVSGYSQRIDKKTGFEADEYLYSVRATRQAWQQLNVANLEAIDVVASFELFELRRKMTATGIFKPVELWG